MREVMLIIHFIALAMAMGAGFSNLLLGSVASKLEPAERGKFMSKILIVGRLGQIGLLILVLSGLSLATPYWKTLGDMPFLVAKIVAVTILVISASVIFVLGNKFKKEKNPAILGKIRPLGMLNFFLGITIVILAVLAFK